MMLWSRWRGNMHKCCGQKGQMKCQCKSNPCPFNLARPLKCSLGVLVTFPRCRPGLMWSTISVLMLLCSFHVRSLSDICMRVSVHICHCNAAANVWPDHVQRSVCQVGAAKREVQSTRLWWGQAINCDEAYEFWELFGLTGDKTSGVNTNASMLNTLINQGRTKRVTRTSTNYGEGVRAKTISLSVLGNGHPKRVIAMERGLIGNHTVACKERFLLVTDHSVARHDKLPPHSTLQTGRYTWLPLTASQAKVFQWLHLLNNPAFFESFQVTEEDDVEDVEEEGFQTEGPPQGFPVVLPDGVPSRVRYVRPPGQLTACRLFSFVR